jgi:hypothetical protein
MEDDPRSQLMDALRARVEASRSRQTQMAADAASVANEASYRGAVESRSADSFLHGLNRLFGDLGPELPILVNRPLGGLEWSEPTRRGHGDHSDELIEYRVAQMTLQAMSCRGSVSAKVVRAADESLVLARTLHPVDLRGEAYQASMISLAHDFIVQALGL